MSPSRRLLVTGGSRGLGLALCRHHARHGRSVATFAREISPELAALAREHPDLVTAFRLDLLQPGAPREAIVRACEALGSIDVLINNAAIGQDSLLAHTSDEEIERIVGLNVARTIQISRHAVRAMIAAGGGAILNVSSICARRGFPGVTAYAASKGALEAFSRSAARELGGHGIVVNCIAPGFFPSDMSGLLGADALGAIRRRTPTGVLTEIAQIVAVSEQLLDAAALNLTGQTIVVDGGATA